MGDVFLQLSGLRLSDGSTAGEKLHVGTSPTSSSYPKKENRDSARTESFSGKQKSPVKPSNRTSVSHSSHNDLMASLGLKSDGYIAPKVETPSPPPQAQFNIMDFFGSAGIKPSTDASTEKKNVFYETELIQTLTAPAPSANTGSIAVCTDVLGGAEIDNLHAKSPIIRTVPTLNAGGRYIVVGDVHGCVDQLRALVEKTKYKREKDVLIIIGDYVNKGPDSVAVVRLCQELGAIGVLGNHDFTLLSFIEKNRRKPFTKEMMRDPVKKLAVEFPLSCERYLRSLPHILKVPSHRVILVHAGLNFQHSLEKQDVMEIMHMRRLESITKVDAEHPSRHLRCYTAISKGHSGVPWGSLWEGPEHVIFGHDASSGFQTHEFATGIDTGCVYGDPLTCVVYTQGSDKQEFVSVPGLPKFSNEKLGLPPPDSDVYEEFENLDRLIFRPTPRTPSVATNGNANPVFLATPPYLTSSTNDIKKLSSAASKGSTHDTRSTPAVEASVSSVVQSSLLTLAKSGEIRAVAKLVALPLYEKEVSLIRKDAPLESLNEFWVPFCKNALTSLSTSTTEVPEEIEAEEDVLQYIFSACEESATLLGELQPLLRSLRDRGSSKKRWSKSILKYLMVLLD